MYTVATYNCNSNSVLCILNKFCIFSFLHSAVSSVCILNKFSIFSIFHSAVQLCTANMHSKLVFKYLTMLSLI